MTIYQKYPSSSDYQVLTTLTTGADRTYSYFYVELPSWGTPIYYARLAGDDAYTSVQSAIVQHA